MTATAATTTTESEGIQVGGSPLTRTRKAEEGNPKESEEEDGRLVVVDSDDRDATADDDDDDDDEGEEVAEGGTAGRGGPSHSLRGNDVLAPGRQRRPHQCHKTSSNQQESPYPRPGLRQHKHRSTVRRGKHEPSSFPLEGSSSAARAPRLRRRRRRRRRRTTSGNFLWAWDARRDVAGANNITPGQQDINAGNATASNNIAAHSNASSTPSSSSSGAGGNHSNSITTNGTYHNNANFSNGTATLAPSSAPTSAMNYQDRVRVALLSLYVTVLVLCFALPVLYYAKLRLGWGMAAANDSDPNRRRRNQRRRRRRNGSMEDDDDDDGDNEDPEDGDRLRRAIERSQVETSETRAFRRKYVEERRARIVQLLAPVQMVLSQDNFAAPATLGSSPFMVSATDPPSSAERKVGKGDEADDDDDDDDDDDACRVRVPVPGVMMVGSRHRAALLLVPGGSNSNSNNNSEAGDSLHGSAKSLAGGGDESIIATSTASLTLPTPPVSQLLYESRWVSGVCSICLCPYQPGDSVCWSSNPLCDHCFHASCIEPWLLKQRDGPLCPICRRDFLIDPYDVVDDEVGSSTPAAAVAAADGGAVNEAAVGRDVDFDVEGATTASADVTSNSNGGDGSNTNTNNNIGRAATTTASNRAMRTQAFGLNWF